MQLLLTRRPDAVLRYSATHPAVSLVGAAAAWPTRDGGVRPVRLPRSAWAQIPSEFMRLMVETAAGVRIRFRTTARTLRVHLRSAAVELVDLAEYPAYVDLLVDGLPYDSQSLSCGRARIDLATGDRADQFVRTVTEFKELTAGEKLVEIWLPHTAVVEIEAVEADGPLQPAEPAHVPRWVHYGSSISHCLEASRPLQTWPAIASRTLGHDLLDLGFAGSAMLDQFVARTIRDAPADFITLKIGINLVNSDVMRLRAFAPAVDGFIDTVRDGHPGTPLVVISPILCPAVEAHPGPTGMDERGQVVAAAVNPIPVDALTLARIRSALAAIVVRRQRSDLHLHYLDGRDLFDDLDVQQGLLPDGLHPNAQGYRLMADRFAAAVLNRNLAVSSAGESA